MAGKRSQAESKVGRGVMVKETAITRVALSEAVAQAAELTKNDAQEVVRTIIEEMVAALNSGEEIELRGFGSFRLRKRGARQGRNPRTGELVDVPAKQVVYFKLGKDLKETIQAVGEKAVGEKAAAKKKR
jgi:integration host factor subunit beta